MKLLMLTKMASLRKYSAQYCSSYLPVGELNYHGEKLIINGGNIGELSQSFMQHYRHQTGRLPDNMGWTQKYKLV